MAAKAPDANAPSVFQARKIVKALHDGGNSSDTSERRTTIIVRKVGLCLSPSAANDQLSVEYRILNLNGAGCSNLN